MPRGRSEKKWEDDTANTLLGLLDGVKSDKGQGVIWVVASNFDDASTDMDEAMLRRFSVKINFRLPNKGERANCCAASCRVRKKAWSTTNDLDLDQVAEITQNLSPALLETVVERASMLSIQEKAIINTDLLFRAYERATIGLTDRATTAEKHKQRERIAVHELGHFFMQIDPHLRAGMSLDEVKEKSHLLKISTERCRRSARWAMCCSRATTCRCARWKSWSATWSACTAAWRRKSCSTAPAASRSAARTTSRRSPRC
jgi:cell division protease FtsH